MSASINTLRRVAPFAVETDHFSLACDAVKGSVHVHVVGHWTGREIEQLREALLGALDALRSAHFDPRQALLMYDASSYQAQSPEIAEKFGLMSDDPALVFRRTAVITSSALQKVQTRRVAPGHGVFSSQAEAEAWLFG